MYRDVTYPEEISPVLQRLFFYVKRHSTFEWFHVTSIIVAINTIPIFHECLNTRMQIQKFRCSLRWWQRHALLRFTSSPLLF